MKNWKNVYFHKPFQEKSTFTCFQITGQLKGDSNISSCFSLKSICYHLENLEVPHVTDKKLFRGPF